MKNHIFKYSLVALATLGICVPNLALAEVSGLGSEEVDIGSVFLGDVKFLVGSNGANNNNVVVKDENSLTNYIGGYDATQSAEQNSISINNSKVGIVMGGYSHSKNTNNNSILLENITLEDYALIVGGNADNGIKSSADNNIITIKNMQQGNDDAFVSVSGGWGSATASNNEIIIENSNLRLGIDGVDGGLALGFDEDDILVNANENKITIINTKINGGVEGGSSRAGNANSNKVTIKDSTIDEVYGGRATRMGEYVLGTAKNNTIEIENSTIKNIYGGASGSGGKVSGNVITINGGTYEDIYGGFGGGTLGSGDDDGKAGEISKNIINFNEGEISGDLMGAGGEFDTQSGIH